MEFDPIYKRVSDVVTACTDRVAKDPSLQQGEAYLEYIEQVARVAGLTMINDLNEDDFAALKAAADLVR